MLREEDKAAARAFFRTPLLLSVHEAKGLEYENVILLNCISGQRAQFDEIARGIGTEDLAGDLEYARGRDKADKSLEIFKFYVIALYVAAPDTAGPASLPVDEHRICDNTYITMMTERRVIL